METILDFESNLAQQATSDLYLPQKSDRFSFGLWTVGSQSADWHGDVTHAALSLPHIVEKLAAIGAWGVNIVDDSLAPSDAPLAERQRAIRDFKRVLNEYEMVVPQVAASLFGHAAFKDGAFTANDPTVRAHALQKTLVGIDVAAELGAGVYQFWSGREGVDSDAGKDPVTALKRWREALNFVCQYVRDQNYNLRIALEPTPTEARSDLYMPTVGHALAFIATLDDPDLVGISPALGHETMAGLNFTHGVAQAIECGKLFHIDLNDQRTLRYDQDARFGSESIKSNFFLVKLLEESGYAGAKHFDAHAYRTEDEAGVWDFASGCMRTYKLLAHKARLFAADPEIQGVLAELQGADQTFGGLLGQTYRPEIAAKLKDYDFDIDSLARRGYRLEKLDQLTIELIMGVR